jgi:hypothetical protein
MASTVFLSGQSKKLSNHSIHTRYVLRNIHSHDLDANCKMPIPTRSFMIQKVLPTNLRALCADRTEHFSSPHTGELWSQRSPCIAPSPLRCDDECNICLDLLGAPACVRVPVIC